MAVKHQHTIPNFILKEWGFDFNSDDLRKFSYYLMWIPSEEVQKINTEYKPNDPAIIEYIYEEKTSNIDGDFLKFNEIEVKILKSIEDKFAVIKEKIINNKTRNIYLTWTENYTIKIFILISWLRSRHNLDSYVWIQRNSDKILKLEDIEKLEGIEIRYDTVDLNNWKLVQLELIKNVFDIFEILISSQQIVDKEKNIQNIFNKVTNKIFSQIMKNKKSSFAELIIKFNFDRDFSYRVWKKYANDYDQKDFRIICEKLHFFNNMHTFIKNFIFRSNLNFIINTDNNFFLPDSMVTQFTDLQMGLNTLSFMPISPKISIAVINSVWSSKFTFNNWTSEEEKFYTSFERQQDLFKKIYIDDSKIKINEKNYKECELNWELNINDYWGNTLGIDSKKECLFSYLEDIRLIKYNFLTEIQTDFFI